MSWTHRALLVAGLMSLGAPALAAPVKAKAVPEGYVSCAADFETCNAPPNRSVSIYYGAGTSYVVLADRGSFVCSPDAFKIADPAPNVAKTCWVKVAGWSPVGAKSAKPVASAVAPTSPVTCGEGASCAPGTGPWTGVYGVAGSYVPIVGTGTFTCALGSFNIADPAFGVNKSCRVRATTLEECTAANTATIAQNRADMTAVVDARKATADEDYALRISQERLKVVGQSLKFGGNTLAKCLDFAQRIADETELVTSIVARPAGWVPERDPLSLFPHHSGFPGWKCADEGGTCKFGARYAGQTFRAFYGDGDKWTMTFVYPNLAKGVESSDGYTLGVAPETSFGCNNGMFGDPAPGVRKSCYLVDMKFVDN